MARVSLADLIERPGDIDAAKLDATTEAEIARYKVEDGYDPDAEPPAKAEVILPLLAIRRSLAMTQAELAALIGVPVARYRAWEQGRATPEPTA